MGQPEAKDVLINGSGEWYDLKGKTITSDSVTINNMGDLHPFKQGPVIHCQKVMLNWCDKNFVYYWLTTDTFPELKHVVLNSHYCEPKVFRRFDNVVWCVTDVWKDQIEKFRECWLKGVKVYYQELPRRKNTQTGF